MNANPPTGNASRRALHNAYLQLLKDEDLWQRDFEKSLRLTINSCAQALGAARVSIWRFNEARDRLYCQMLCNQSACSLEPQLEHIREEHKNYFDALEHQSVVTAHNAQKDPVTESFCDYYLKPLGITSKLDIALRDSVLTVGVLCVEHIGPAREWNVTEQNYALGIAGLISQLLTVNALYKSEEQYRKVFDSTGDAVVLMHDFRMIDCNQSALQLFECSIDQFASHAPARFWAEVQPDGRTSTDKAQPYIEAAYRGEPQLFEWRMRRFNGSEFDAEVSLSHIELNGVPHLVASVRDISERKATEKKIRELLSLQQAIFDGANYSIISTNLDGKIISYNRAAEALLNYPQDEVIDLKTPLFFHDEDEIHWRAIELSDVEHKTLEPGFDVLVHSARSGLTEEREWTYVRSDGRRIPVLISVTALRDSDNSINGFLFIASDISERKKANEQLLNSKREMEFRANHDDLTGLPNRIRLHDMTHAAIVTANARDQHLALMLIDLDRFKEINDTLGHALGDQLLKSIADRLNSLLTKRGSQLYRLGGDEFAVLMPFAFDEEDTYSLAKQIHACLRTPLKVDDISLEIGGSIGISLYPNHGDNSHALLRCADVAMYRAKVSALGTVFYEAEQDGHSPRRLRMMAELGTAIRENQLVLHYQPRISLASNHCLGAEALVRWEHPRLGLVPPGEFIPLAEMSELIHPLGFWVLDNALQQIKSWQTQGLDLEVSINLSARNLMDEAFPTHIQRLLEQYEVPPHLLEIEITESTLISDPERALGIINKISKLGVRFAIDDFGTGYSSLSYLKRLPINILKIDRSFIRDMLTDEQDAVIVRSTLGLAHSFGMHVVAEGVEDSETLNVLKQLSCEQAQGFLISKPITSQEFENWLKSYRVRYVGDC